MQYQVSIKLWPDRERRPGKECRKGYCIAQSTSAT